MSYGKSNDLTRTTESDKVLRDKAFEIASDSNSDIVELNLCQIINLQMKFIDRLLGSLREEKFIHLLEAIFGVLVQLICNH